MAKLNLLFDFSKFEKRKSADQEEFEQQHKDELPIFNQIMGMAFEMLTEESSRKARHYKGRNYHAELMSGNIRGLLLDNFPNWVKVGDHDRIMFCKKGTHCLYFKKLDDRKMPNNIRTEYVELVAYQRTIPGGERTPIIFIGYTVDDMWTQLTGVYAVYIEDNKRRWVTEIFEEGGQASGKPIIIPQPVAPDKGEAEIARPKRVRRKAS